MGIAQTGVLEVGSGLPSSQTNQRKTRQLHQAQPAGNSKSLSNGRV